MNNDVNSEAAFRGGVEADSMEFFISTYIGREKTLTGN